MEGGEQFVSWLIDLMSLTTTLGTTGALSVDFIISHMQIDILRQFRVFVKIPERLAARLCAICVHALARSANPNVVCALCDDGC